MPSVGKRTLTSRLPVQRKAQGQPGLGSAPASREPRARVIDPDIDFCTALGFVPSPYAVQMKGDGAAGVVADNEDGVCEPQEAASEYGVGVCEPEQAAMASEYADGVCEPEQAAMASEYADGVCEPQGEGWSGDWDGTDAAQDVSGGAGAVLRAEALLRDLYQSADEAIYREAQYMRSRGVPEPEVARWATQARNAAKAKIRKWDLDVVRILAERRNMARYGDKLGPSYEKLRNGDRELRIRSRSDKAIIESARKSNARVNRWAGKLKIAGRIMIGIDVGIAGYQVVTAESHDRPKVLITEASGIAGALAGGWAGAKGGGSFGSLGGPWGAGIGAVVGGVGGAIVGGWAGRKGGELLVDRLYPPADTAFIGSFQ